MQISKPNILKERSRFLPFTLSWPQCPHQLGIVSRAPWGGHPPPAHRALKLSIPQAGLCSCRFALAEVLSSRQAPDQCEVAVASSERKQISAQRRELTCFLGACEPGVKIDGQVQDLGGGGADLLADQQK